MDSPHTISIAEIVFAFLALVLSTVSVCPLKVNVSLPELFFETFTMRSTRS